jgi:hypothetical protein
LFEEQIHQEKNMTENIQAKKIQYGLISELIDTLKLVTIFAIKRIHLQHVLFLIAFLTFGIGDGITGAYMMEKLGTGIEANPVARYLFTEQGFGGVVIAKVWFTLVILFIAFIVQLKSYDSIYWTMNGFLIALSAGGLMAINANLTALAGEMPQAPGEIVFTYLAMVLMFTEVGSIVDRRTAYPENARIRSGFYEE